MTKHIVGSRQSIFEADPALARAGGWDSDATLPDVTGVPIRLPRGEIAPHELDHGDGIGFLVRAG